MSTSPRVNEECAVAKGNPWPRQGIQWNAIKGFFREAPDAARGLAASRHRLHAEGFRGIKVREALRAASKTLSEEDWPSITLWTAPISHGNVSEGSEPRWQSPWSP